MAFFFVVFQTNIGAVREQQGAFALELVVVARARENRAGQIEKYSPRAFSKEKTGLFWRTREEAEFPSAHSPFAGNEVSFEANGARVFNRAESRF